MAENDNPQPIAAPDIAPDMLPITFAAPGFLGMLNQMAHGLIRGWVYRVDHPHPVVVSMYEGERLLATVTAELWREEKAKLRGGNGYCGFEMPVPEAICDGRLHEVEFRVATTGQALTARPIRLLPGRRVTTQIAINRSMFEPEPASYPLKLSVIVNFYNMRREAERTLASLSRAYQRGIGDLNYEEICIDNGSEPPLDPDWIASFGPEFRLFRPERKSSSPCVAINEAAAAARGEFLAIMIDGAHLLTPGVFAEAMAAFAENPASIVAVRYWFVGGDQRWLHAAGYTREMEDKIFERIHWPANGYLLFSVGSPIGESPTSWVDSLIESNCLFLPAAQYRRIGGMDEDFSEPGGGFVNLDFFRRATLTAGGGVVSLIGEASFHQYHEGTTTNVSDDEKDARVRAYNNRYRELRGGIFQAVERHHFRFRGSIHTDDSVRVLKSSSVPLNLSVTERVRPSTHHGHFPPPVQRYLQAAYVECGLHQLATWRGKPVGVSPADLLNFQEVIRLVKPECVILTSSDVGLLRFVDDVLHLLGLEQSRIVRVAATPPPGAGPARVRTVIGKHDAPETLAQVEALVAGSERVLVLYAPAPGVLHPGDTVAAYAKFVSQRSYLIFLGTVLGQPWLGYSAHWFVFGIQRFLASTRAFKIDTSWDRQVLTSCASGYLLRVDAPGKYDDALDQLEQFESTAP